MTDIEQPAEEPVDAPGPEPAPEEPPAAEEPETPTEPLQAFVWVAQTRVRYEDDAGNEFFCGPGETIPDEFIEQIGVDNVSAG